MKKEIICEKCKGTGKVEILVCDICGSEDHVGLDPKDGRHKCQQCWMNELTEEEIEKL